MSDLTAAHGMKRHAGSETAPSDWNGGRVLLADDTILHPYMTDSEFDWRHSASETGALEPGCIVGYFSATPTPPAGGQ